MNLHQVILEGWNRHKDVDAVTDYVFNKVTKNDLRALLRGEVRKYERADTRKAETKAFSPPTPRSASVGTRERYSPIEERMAFMSKYFGVPGQFWVTWKDGSIDQHRAYAEYLRGMAAKTNETAAHHEKAGVWLEEKGYQSLGEATEAELKEFLS